MRSGVAIVIALIVLAWASRVSAHESRPIYVEITETNSEVFAVQWKVPTTVSPANVPAVRLPANCAPVGEGMASVTSAEFLRRQVYRCPDGLTGQVITIEFPVFNPSITSLVRVQLLSGEKHTGIVRPGEETWRIPERETWLAVARDYTRLGILHIWGGIDHLLFLGCLLLIAGRGHRVIITITGFTLAHSVTLALSALDIVRVPVPPVEAVIALSIVFLASEIAKKPRDTLTYRHPIIVSSSFGLLHGFGFAAVLRDIGLPQTEIPASLLFFNIGVEIGQIIFVLGVVGVLWGIRSIAIRMSQDPARLFGRMMRAEQVGAYVIGSVASYWLIQRITSFWR